MNNYTNCSVLDETCWYDREKRILYCREYGTLCAFEESYENFQELYSFPRQSNLIQIQVDEPYEGEKRLIVSAGCKVGIEKVGELTVFVFPKVKNADFLTMVNYAYDFLFDFQKEKVELDQDPRNLTAVFLKFILLQLQKFLAWELRRSIVKRDEYLTSKVKGKVMLSEYLNNSVPSKRDNLIPCQFHEIQVDCLENQIIRYTIEVAQKVLHHIVFSQPLRQEMMSLCNSMLQKMGRVSSRKIELSDFNRVRYVGRFKHYRYIHELCRVFLEASKIEMQEGRFAFYGFSIDMNALFEKFVTGVLKKEAGLKIDAQKKGSFQVNGKTKNVRLDGWLSQEKLVFDTKYKETFEVPQGGDIVELGPLKILNSDIYQIVAYCNHQSFYGSTGVLIYPLISTEGNAEKCYVIEGFNSAVYVLGISLDFKDSRGRPGEILEFVKVFCQVLNKDREMEEDANDTNLGKA